MEECSTLNDLQKWERLVEEQSSLFRLTLTDNQTLRLRADELERELSVWKLAFKAAEDEKCNLQRHMLKLEKNIGSLKDDNPLLLCLIDGDGNIFSQDLLASGHTGGRQAAMLLTKGLTDYMVDVDAGSSCRGQVWLTVYCNKTGLMDTLVNNGICSASEFEAFVLGFNSASPLFSIVDVGGGKEAADAKIKVFVRLTLMWFQGGHDNGYTSTLSTLENEGLLEKIVLLRGYKTLAAELQHFDLPHLDIGGVFMTKKLPSSYTHRRSTPPTGVTPQEHDRQRINPKNFLVGTQSPIISTSTQFCRYLDPSLRDVDLFTENPRPCTFFYLSVCKQGDKCTYGHDYFLTADNYAELRANAKKISLPHQPCPYGESCPSGHYCPRGSKCGYRKQGKCKFIGREMHTPLNDRISISGRPPSRAQSSNVSGQTDGTPTPPMSPVDISNFVGLSPFVPQGTR
ncbi:hypothetical protein DFJ58DRAFT_772914 [Suillus subalutaceus]|uniref:uncharacterized protein n=1 Tax=Suillus subalutaceus TaxID=48586 RepID=UPI001B8803F1|nr:uncharacterized protein DFJ58DRAFT_772914 [Suillus subalutaceus]KAG1864169.1 hypothetical protein DFJ58DRAFT_772914 [Suillus subalutaceus]